MSDRVRRGQAGLAPVELLVVGAIVTLLAAVTVPAYVRYVQRAKTFEAIVSLDRIVAGATAYFRVPRIDPISGSRLAKQFPNSVSHTPAVGCSAQVGARCKGRDVGWTNSTWRHLHFAMENAHHYNYEFTSSGADTAAQFTAIARGNLDTDAVFATFRREGSVGPQNIVTVTPIVMFAGPGGQSAELE